MNTMHLKAEGWGWWMCFVVMVFAAVVWSGSGYAAPAVELQTGSFQGAFTVRVAASHPDNLITRFGAKKEREREHAVYDITQEKFDVHVPPDYDGKTRYGVLVWMSGGEPPEEWLAILQKHKLIWVAPKGVWASRDVFECYGLPLDALGNIARDYKKIDKKRLYIGGVGYGGRLAVRMGVAYSDTFAGALTCGSVDFFRRVDLPSNALRRYSAAYTKPVGSAVGIARQKTRFVFWVPEAAPIDGQYMATIINGFREMKFRHCRTIDVYSQIPDALAFDEAFVFMAK